jgi:hypothetical protein
VAAGADAHAVNGDGCNLLQFALRGLGGNPLNLAVIKYLIEDVKVKPTVSKHGTVPPLLLDVWLWCLFVSVTALART